MFRIWSERAIPPGYYAMLENIAVSLGSASDDPEDPLATLSDAQAVIASTRIQYDAKVMDLNPSLLVISRTGIGTDNIAVSDATDRGIVVCNAPDAPTVSTAEMTITLMLALARDLKSVSRSLEKGERKDFFNDYRGLEINGLHLGLIGLGRIGSRVAQLATALGMRVSGYDPYVSLEYARSLGIELVPTLEALLPGADIISLHVPVNPETHHIINAVSLAQMKPGAILINTARGGLVDEDTLLAALDRGHLRGAGLDVLAQKPGDIPLDHPLLNRENVIVTPHIASATGTGKDRLWRSAISQALMVLRGERPSNIVNPEVWENARCLNFTHSRNERNH